jgi:hypothetical protein
MDIDDFFERLKSQGMEYCRSYLTSDDPNGSYYIFKDRTGPYVYFISSKTILSTEEEDADVLITSIVLNLLF